MDSLVEENGNLDPLADHDQSGSNEHNSGYDVKTVLTSSPNLVQFIPSSSIQTQSVIQANQSSVIQTAAATSNPHTIQKRILYINKPNSVIHTAGANAIQNAIQVQIKPEPSSQHMLDTNSDETTDDDSPNRRLIDDGTGKEIYRRPSYNKILKDISTPDIGGPLPMQITDSGGISSISPGGAGIMCQDSSQFYISNNTNIEDQTRKREIRLQKNREAARECRRKKKEYIKCLENRVAVLENQNKALIDELKSLKELYCQTKND